MHFSVLLLRTEFQKQPGCAVTLTATLDRQWTLPKLKKDVKLITQSNFLLLDDFAILDLVIF